MISIPGPIPIYISPFFWLLIFLLGWVNSGTLFGTAVWAGIIIFSVLVHEMGHALTARLFGQKAEIELVAFGGLTRRTGKQIRAWQEFIVIFNGPLAGFMLFLIASFLLPHISAKQFPLSYEILKVTLYVNLFWTFLNLLPVLPLDGGHLLRVILEGLFGVTGVKISLIISMAIAIIIGMFFFLVYQALLIGALFLILAFESYRAWMGYKTVTAQDVDFHLQDLFKEAQEDLKVGQINLALPKLIHLRERTKRGVLFVSATEYAARILAKQGQTKQAYEWLLEVEKYLSPDYLYLLQQLAFQLQEWETVIRIGNHLYQRKPLNEVAVFNALSCGIVGLAKPAVGWLRCLEQGEYSNLHELIQRREFDAVRSSPDFQAFAKSLE